MPTILPGSTIGIIGGGQLGRMMSLAAKEMGYQIAVLDPIEHSPTGQIADVEIVAPYNDLNAAKKLAQVSDVITYEFENVDHNVLDWLEENAYLPQGSNLIHITQDRINEKKAVEKSGANVVPYYQVDTDEEFYRGLEVIGMPSVLKTRSGGYDGKGQTIIASSKDIEEAKKLLKNGPCILEKYLHFDKELSVIVNRNSKGEITTFPVAENVHVEHILLQSIVPANVNDNIKRRAEKMAIQLAESMDMIGTLGVEMFLAKDGELFINELAPRPHNSGHYTMNACETSQFHQHVRAICNWPLAPTRLLTPAIMMNVLGEHLKQVLQKVSQLDTCKLHLYGKVEVKPKRKMGHINIIGETQDLILEKIEQLQIWQDIKLEVKR